MKWKRNKSDKVNSKVTEDETENTLIDGGLKWLIDNSMNYGLRFIQKTLKRKERDGWNWDKAPIILEAWEEYLKENDVHPKVANQGRRALLLSFVLLDDDTAYMIHAQKFLKKIAPELIK